MAVEDLNIAVYDSAGTTIISRLSVKTDGNVSAEFSAASADDDLITKGFADSAYAIVSHNHDGTYAPDVHNHDDRYYQETEFVDESAGTADAGKPIILDGNGLISDTMLDVATFIYQGNWTPTSGTEYPSTSGLDIGAFWTIDGLSPDYTFTGGDLAGETVTNDDLIIWGTEGWAMTKRDEDMSVYYKLDGSRAITDSFAGGGQQIKNIADATADSDAMTKGQADAAYAPIGIGGGDFMSDGSVPMTGDFQGGGNKLTGIADATLDTDALTKGQADDAYAPIGVGGGDFYADGSVPMTGDFDGGDNRLTNIGNAVAASDGLTKGQADADYVKIDGTSVMDASLKIKSNGDVDTYVLFGRDSDGSFKGGVGCIDPSESMGLILFESDGSTIANFVYLTPDGNVRLSNFIAPTDDKHLVTKKWVEDNAGGGGEKVFADAVFTPDGTVQRSTNVSGVMDNGTGDWAVMFAVHATDINIIANASPLCDNEKFGNVRERSDNLVRVCCYFSADNSHPNDPDAMYVTVFHGG